MANRHLSRSVAMQSLFEWDFNGHDNSKMDGIIAYNAEEFAPGMEDVSFVKRLVKNVLDNKDQLDKVIEKAAPDWPLDQISIIDRNILRLGLYELVFGNKKEVPAKVAINEAIELAKSFGGESSGRFVNGVLGTVYREMGGEAEEPMIEESLGGAVVYRKDGEDFYLALVHDVFGRWTLSKGHIEAGESLEEGVKREIKEEIGVDIKLEENIGSNEYIASDPERGKIKKKVNYFLASTNEKRLNLKESGGLTEARWFKMEDIADLNMYGDMKPIILKAVKILTEK